MENIEGSIEAGDGSAVISYSGADDEAVRAFMESENKKYGLSSISYTVSSGEIRLSYPEGTSYEIRKECSETLVRDLEVYFASVAAAAEPEIIVEPVQETIEPLPAEPFIPVYLEFDVDGIEGSIEAGDGVAVIAYSGTDDETAKAFIESEKSKYGLEYLSYTSMPSRVYLSYPAGVSYDDRLYGAETLIRDLEAYLASLTVIVVPAGEPEIIEESVITESDTETETTAPFIPVYIEFSVEGIDGSIKADDGYAVIEYSGVDSTAASAFLGEEAEKYGITGVEYTVYEGKAEILYAEGLSYDVRFNAAETLINDIKRSVVSPSTVSYIPAALEEETEPGEEEEKSIHSIYFGISPWAYHFYDFYNAPVTDNSEFETKYGFGLKAGYEARILSFLGVGVEAGYAGFSPTRSIIPADSYYWSVPVLAKAAFLIGDENFDFRIGAHAGVDISKLNADINAYFICGIDFGFDFHITEDISIFWRVRNSISFQPHRDMEILSSNTLAVEPAILGITYHI